MASFVCYVLLNASLHPLPHCVCVCVCLYLYRQGLTLAQSSLELAILPLHTFSIPVLIGHRN